MTPEEYMAIEGPLNGYPRSDPRSRSEPPRGALTLLDIADTLDEMLAMPGDSTVRYPIEAEGPAQPGFPLFAAYQEQPA